MIVATIGHTSLKLESIADAEALLSITSRATLVAKSYDLNYRDYHYIDQGEKRIDISVIEGETILTFDDHRAMADAHAEKERQAKAAKQAADQAAFLADEAA